MMRAAGLSPLAPLRSSSGEALNPYTDSRPSVRGCGAASSRGKQPVVSGATRLQWVLGVVRVATR